MKSLPAPCILVKRSLRAGECVLKIFSLNRKDWLRQEVYV